MLVFLWLVSILFDVNLKQKFSNFICHALLQKPLLGFCCDFFELLVFLKQNDYTELLLIL